MRWRRPTCILLFYTIWFTWFELCQGYGVRVLPEEFELLYWINMGILFFVSISLALNVRSGLALTLPVMIFEDIAITTVHRAFEGGVWSALIHWSLENHPLVRRWHSVVAEHGFWLKLSSLEGFMVVNVLAVACFIVGFRRELVRLYHGYLSGGGMLYEEAAALPGGKQ